MVTNYTTSRGVQYFSITIGSGFTSATATINSVGAGAFILFNGVNPTVSNNPSADFAYLTLTNSTTVTATRGSTTGSVVVKGCIVDGDVTNLIKSVQYGVMALSGTSDTFTISAVTTANSVIHFLGTASSATSYNSAAENPVLQFNNSTTVFASVGAAASFALGFVVIEFQPGALNSSTQFFGASASASTIPYTYATPSSVNLSNAFLVTAGCISGSTTNLSIDRQIAYFGSSTNVSGQVGIAGSNPLQYNFWVVEFKSGVLNRAVQLANPSIASATSQVQALTSTVNPNFAAISYLGAITSVTTPLLDQGLGAIALTGSGASTTATTNSSTPRTAVWGHVLEFPAYQPTTGVGSATGTATVSGVGALFAAVTGTATGTNVATAVSNATAASPGSATGTATVSGIGAAQLQAIGSSQGFSTAQAIGLSLKYTTGSTTGLATVMAVGQSAHVGVGSAVGLSSASTVGTIGTVTIGSAIGSSNANAVSTALKLSVGRAVGTSYVEAFLPPVPLYLDALAFMSKQNVNSAGLMTNSPVSILGSFQ